MTSMPADIVEEVKSRSQLRLREMMREVVRRQLRDDGTTYGDVNLSRGERITRFYDWAQWGVLDIFRTVKPGLLERLERQYMKDMAAESSKEAPEPSTPSLPVGGGY